MNTPDLPLVFGKDGLRGRLETDIADVQTGPVSICLEDGRQIQVGKKMLHAQEDGSYFLPFSISELEQACSQVTAGSEGNLTVPIVAEEFHVSTRTVETGRVRIHKEVREEEEIVDPPLQRHNVTVERVAINRPWEGPVPQARQEGEVMIIPVLEEVLVVEKRLFLKEEVHIRQEQSTFHAPQSVTVRREEVHIERVTLPDVSETPEPTPNE